MSSNSGKRKRKKSSKATRKSPGKTHQPKNQVDQNLEQSSTQNQSEGQSSNSATEIVLAGLSPDQPAVNCPNLEKSVREQKEALLPAITQAPVTDRSLDTANESLPSALSLKTIDNQLLDLEVVEQIHNTSQARVQFSTIVTRPFRNKLVRSSLRFGLTIALMLLLSAAITTFFFLQNETTTSALQSRLLSQLNTKLGVTVNDGPSANIRFPQSGPYDLRLGYVQLPDFISRLTSRGFEVSAQAQILPEHSKIIDYGIFPIYKPKIQSGLQLFDRVGLPLYVNHTPEAIYSEFESIPTVIVDTLLYIEDRNVLNRTQPLRNPAIDWRRFTKAILDMAKRRLDPDHDVHGGSTLATQIEKFRHSPKGITTSPKQKLQQMASASIRSYIDGPQNFQARRQIVRDYINSVPLAALPGYGEVTGLADGMWAYFGADINQVNDLLISNETQIDKATLDRKALAFRQVLSLFLAHRRPTEYLRTRTAALAEQVDKYLPLLYRERIISRQLLKAALQQKVGVQRILPVTKGASFLQRKGANALRTHLMQQLGLNRLYDMDRMDISANATLDKTSQDLVSKLLLQLHQQEYVQKAGLDGFRLLTGTGALKDVIYSATLYESDGKVNRLLIQTDNYDQPFDINDGVKLDLGSTAKLRTLVTYLEIIEEIYHKQTATTSSDESPKPDAIDNSKNPPDPNNLILDKLSTWVQTYLKGKKDASLEDVLLAAMERKYSANPGERFFTAGGLHTFENFNKEDNSRVVTVRTALQKSINLPFIRIMRDIAEYSSLNTSGSTARTLRQMDGLTRNEYLTRFADKEGKIFLRRYFRQYSGGTPSSILEQFWSNVQQKPYRFAALPWVFNQDKSLEYFKGFMQNNCTDVELSNSEIERIFRQYSARGHTLADIGYMARVHPLELWVVAYLIDHPNATLTQAVEAGAQARQDVYRWLFKTTRRGAQDSRIRIMLEAEAFIEIHRRWKRLGYPLNSLVPSYATALGTSADRPSALAKLMGIILNDGKRLPVVKIEEVSFASGTPFETRLHNRGRVPKQLLSPTLARIIREALTQVVDQGTAIRLKNSFDSNENKVAIGGKTGTGDHRFQVFGSGGQLKSSRVISRSATFVFFIGPKHFGTITAFVHGEEAEKFRFTSALPVQLLKILQPALTPIVNPSTAEIQPPTSIVKPQKAIRLP